MAYNGSGAFSRPVSAYTYDTVISETDMNTEMDGIATGLSNAICKDGQTTVTANLPMATYRHTGVGNASARTDYAAAGQVQDSTFLWGGTAGGTADALTITPSPAITAYAAGQTFRFIAGGSQNTGAATINVNSVGAKAIQNNGSALAAGDIAAGKMYQITYDGTQFQLSHVVVATPTTLGLVIGTDVQAYDADTAKTDVSQSWDADALQRLDGTKDAGSLDALGSDTYTVELGSVIELDADVDGKIAAPSSGYGFAAVYIYNNGTRSLTLSGFPTDALNSGTLAGTNTKVDVLLVARTSVNGSNIIDHWIFNRA